MENKRLILNQIEADSALLVVDMQYDFLPGGALPVQKGDEIIEKINELIEIFYSKHGKIVFTQDWHPFRHLSFASAHKGTQPGDSIDLLGIGPILWPDHCIQNSKGSQIHEKMHIDKSIAVIRKGYNSEIDSYSAFLENDKRTKTGLAGFLHELKIKSIYICGLATDYCCYYSAMDGKAAGFNVFFLENLTRGIDLPKGNIIRAKENMQSYGIELVDF